MDKRYHKNWQIYENYNPAVSAEEQQTVIDDSRMEGKKVQRQQNLTKERYKKSPSEKLKEQLVALYKQLPSPSEELTAELRELGVIEWKRERTEIHSPKVSYALTF